MWWRGSITHAFYINIRIVWEIVFVSVVETKMSQCRTPYQQTLRLYFFIMSTFIFDFMYFNVIFCRLSARYGFFVVLG